MKKTIILFSVLVLGFNANAQDLKEADVPSEVKTQFASLYPDVKSVKWEKEYGKYEAEFVQSKVETSVLFEANGTLVQIETEIEVSSLPEGVSVYVSKKLGGEKIKEATKIIDASGKVTYEAEVGNTDYLFDENGNFLKKEVDSPDDKDDDRIKNHQ